MTLRHTTRVWLKPSVIFLRLINLQDIFSSSYIVHKTTVVVPGVASQAASVETGNKYNDDFHCMQLRLVKSMWFTFGDD